MARSKHASVHHFPQCKICPKQSVYPKQIKSAKIKMYFKNRKLWPLECEFHPKIHQRL